MCDAFEANGGVQGGFSQSTSSMIRDFGASLGGESVLCGEKEPVEQVVSMPLKIDSNFEVEQAETFSWKLHFLPQKIVCAQNIC